MKYYNFKNYLRYKEDLKKSDRIDKPWKEYSRDELIVKLMPFVEGVARSFSTADKASGVVSVNDMIQEGNMALVYAVDKIDWNEINEQDDIERQLKGFVYKRIKGSIRRAVDAYRGDIKIPEYVINDIRNNDDDKRKVAMFFNAVFDSLDAKIADDTDFQVIDVSKKYNIGILNAYILGLMRSCLDDREYEVIRMSYGLDCDRMQAKKIAKILNIDGVANYVRVSQIKRDALDKLTDNIKPSQILEYL